MHYHAVHLGGLLLDVFLGNSHPWQHLPQQHLRRSGRSDGCPKLWLVPHQVQGLDLLHLFQCHLWCCHLPFLLHASGSPLVLVLHGIRLRRLEHVQLDLRAG